MKAMKKLLKHAAIVLLLLLGGDNSIQAQVTYYVDAARANNSGTGTSWATAKRDLQNAIIPAVSGDQVWVKAGTYLPTHDPFANAAPANNRDKTFTLKNGVKIYGGFAGVETLLSQRNWQTNSTTLSGDLGVLNTPTDNAYHLVLSINLNGAVLDGFSITKGYATAPSLSSVTVGTHVIDRFKGGGIYNAFSSTTFTNCTIRANSADCTNTDDDAAGAGMVNYFSSSAISNCNFESNSFLIGGQSFGVYGCGMIIIGGSISIDRCVFANNNSGSGFIDASRGGAIHIENTTSSIVNSVFYNNTAISGAAFSFGGASGNMTTVTNCTVANNTSRDVGTSFAGFAKATFKNSIFWNNAPTGSGIAGRNEIYSFETNVANQPTFINCIIRDAAGSPLSVTNTIMSGTLNSNPIFVNAADADGADNIFLTADDGLRLQCTSPAIGAGNGSTPTNDILGLTRTTVIDIGAYEGEHSNTAFNSLTTTNATIYLAQNTSGITNYSNCNSQVAAVQSGGSYTVSGSVTARVWIQNIQPLQYVKRHYEIMPANNAGTATGRITLYFTQAEFTEYNAQSPAPTLLLPISQGDAIGKANLQIEKRGGISADGSGLPNSYTGGVTTINPLDADIVWNNTASRWEITFDATGFSGFFVKTSLSPLPLYWLAVSGNVNTQKQAVINWQVQENNVARYEIEKSNDGRNFVPVAILNSKGNGTNMYRHTHQIALDGISFFRIKQTDIDGKFTYSTIVKLSNHLNTLVSVFPNPAKDVVTISVGGDLINTEALLMDMSGKILESFTIQQSSFTINITRYSNALYLLKFENGSKVKIVKQ